MKTRLDRLLTDLGLVNSREQAQKYIRAGWVKINGAIVDKPGAEFLPDVEVEVKSRAPFVSRGGEKLAGAIAAFPITVRDRVCLDGGISTGGFTDCLLQQGARLVYGIDVGYGQVAWEIRSDARVILKERTNLRYLLPEDLYRPDDVRPDLAVLDLSFISLAKVLPALWCLLEPPREVLLLVKPQFEAGKEQVGKHGIVREPKVRAIAIQQVLDSAAAMGWHFRGMTPSPIQGNKSGNFEYWLWMAIASTATSVPTLAEIEAMTV